MCCSLEYTQLMHAMWIQPAAAKSQSLLITSPHPSIGDSKPIAQCDAIFAIWQLMGLKHSEFGYMSQNDAQEFLRLFMNDLHEELKLAVGDKNNIINVFPTFGLRYAFVEC